MKLIFVFPVLAVLLFIGCVSQPTYDFKSQEVASLSSKNGDLEAQVKILTEDLDNMRKDLESLQKEKDTLETEYRELRKEKESLLREKAALSEKISELSEKAEKEEQLEKSTQTYQNSGSDNGDDKPSDHGDGG